MWHTRSGRLQVYQQAPEEQESTGGFVGASRTSVNRAFNLTQGTTITAKATTGTGRSLPPTLQKLIKRTVVLPSNQTRLDPPVQALSPTSEKGKAKSLNISRYRATEHHQDEAPQPLPRTLAGIPTIQSSDVRRFQGDQRESHVAARIPNVPSRDEGHRREDPHQHLVSGHTSTTQSGARRGKRDSQRPNISTRSISQSNNTGQRPDPTQDQIEVSRRLAPVEMPGQTTSRDHWGCANKRELVSGGVKVSQPAGHNDGSLKQEKVAKQGLRSDELPHHVEEIEEIEEIEEFEEFEEFEEWYSTPTGQTRYVDGTPPLQPENSRPVNDNQGSLTPWNPAETTDTQPWHDFRCDETVFPDFVDEYSDDIFAYMKTKEVTGTSFIVSF